MTLIEAIAAKIPKGSGWSDAQLDAAGVALGPALRRWLAHDITWLAQRLRWDLATGLPILPAKELIAAHAGVFASDYARVNLPGRALALDAGSDSMRFVYFDEASSEPPVLYIDHDDTPTIGVACPSFDLWIAKYAGVIPWASTEGADEAARVSQRLFGSPDGLDLST